MAIDVPKIKVERVLAALAETTTGTAITLTKAAAAMNVFEPDLQFGDSTFTERPGQGSATMLSGVRGKLSGMYTFKSELVGNGSSGLPLWSSTLLAASGFLASGTTYSPITGSESAVTLTMGDYMDGRKRAIAGAVGTWELTLADGEPGMFDWEFAGKWTDPTDSTILVPTYPTTLPPIFAGATFTVSGTTYKINELKITCEQEKHLREDVTDDTGYFSAILTGQRKITVTIDPEQLAIATKDWYALFKANTTAALSIVIGSDSNNTMTITAPAMQLTAPPEDSDRGGMATENLTFQCTRAVASLGDNELTIAFS